MTNHRTIADAYHRALEHGIVTAAEVVAWVDHVIATDDSPAIAFIDASCAGEDSGVILTALGEVPGDGDPIRSSRLTIGLMKRLVEREPGRYPTVTKALYSMALDGLFPHASAEHDMWRFDDDLGLAIDGVHGSEKEISREILAFLQEHGDDLEFSS